MLRRTTLSLVAAVVCALLIAAPVRAQELTGEEAKPAVIVAFSGYDELISDLNFVGNLAGNPQLGKALEMIAAPATGGHELKSLDKSKPWGVVAYADGPEPRILGFLPLGDLEEAKAILESRADEIDEADGLLTASFNGQKVYLKGKGGWVFLSNQADLLNKLPEDPTAILGGLEKSYNLAVRLSVQDVPEEVREMLLSLLQMGMQTGMSPNPGESDEEFARRTKLADQGFEELKRAVGELDAIQLGLAIDEKVPSIYLDVKMTALPGTETAKRLMAPKDVTTKFGGFVAPDAAVSYNGVSPIEPDQAEQINATVDGFRTTLHEQLDEQNLPEDVGKTAKRLVDDAFSIVTSTVKEGEADLGVLLLTGEKRATLLGGTRVADGSKVEDLLKAVVEEAAKEMPELKEAVKFNAAEHAGVRLHTLSVPTAELGLPQLSELFGDELPIVVGTADKAVYLSVGTEALETLEKAIDDSKAADKELPPSKVTISVGSLARLAAQYAPDPQAQAVAKMIADKLADSKGKDRLTITTTIPENGQKYRIEIEEGLLKLLGIAPAIMMGAAPAGG